MCPKQYFFSKPKVMIFTYFQISDFHNWSKWQISLFEIGQNLNLSNLVSQESRKIEFSDLIGFVKIDHLKILEVQLR